MIPGVSGFHWDAGHIVFLGAFYSVAALIAITVARSLMRTRSAMQSGREPHIRWHADFHGLPERSRRCRHELNGEIDSRQCPHSFDCRVCDQHSSFGPAAPADAPSFEVLGITIPLDRRYHRGHTWVRGERDGTFTTGLDPVAARLIGSDAQVELPAIGTKLEVNGPAWTVKGIRVLAPINGTVVETSNGAGGWCLKIQPDGDAQIAHLLTGSEVKAWMSGEVERLQVALSAAGVGAALADGGSLVENPGRAYPARAWAEAMSELLLEP